MTISLWVAICMGCGDGGDVSFSMTITDEEYNRLKNLCDEKLEKEYDDPNYDSNDDISYEYDDIDDLIYSEMPDLYEKIKEEAFGEDEYCSKDLDIESDYSSASIIIQSVDFDE